MVAGSVAQARGAGPDGAAFGKVSARFRPAIRTFARAQRKIAQGASRSPTRPAEEVIAFAGRPQPTMTGAIS
jgi:hypothetical protein